ncbi:MAG: serine protease [Planctomycetota bacterium]
MRRTFLLFITLAFALHGCASTPREEIRPTAIDAAFKDTALAARFLIRLTTHAENGRAQFTAGTGVQLAPDVILTAAHCVPETLLWDHEPEAPIVIDDARRTATLISSGLDERLAKLRGEMPRGYGADSAELARERQRNIFSSHDWALLRIEPPILSPAVDRLTYDPVSGEPAWLIGFPHHHIPPSELRGLSWPLAEGWTPPSPLVFAGTIGRIRDGWMNLNLEGTLASFGGASGSGVFVLRDGALALVGVASQVMPGTPIVVVARLPVGPADRLADLRASQSDTSN